MNNAVLESRSVKESNCQNMEIIEPATNLTCVFNDKVRGEVVLKPFFIFKGIMLLRKGNTSAFKPTVKNLGNTVHSASALGTLECYLVHILSVKVIKSYTACLLNFINTAVFQKRQPHGAGL